MILKNEPKEQKNIFVEKLTTLQGYNEGISCLACHSIQKTDIQGNANYTMVQPTEYLWQWSADHTVGAVARNFLIRAWPAPHNHLSKRMYKKPQYCAACHKQFIDQEVNRVGWVQLQNQYDNWAASRPPLEAASRLNSEETGTLTLLGQVALALGDFSAAEKHFMYICQTNPRAVNAWYLRGYIAWKRRDFKQASAMLATAREARGRDWKPTGTALEGDVQRRMYSESGFLNVFEQQWDGSMEPARSYDQLDAYLQHFRR